MDDDQGTSLVIVNSDKGEQALASLDIEMANVTYDEAKRYNPSIETSATEHPNRSYFFQKAHKTHNISKLIRKALRAPLRYRIKYTLLAFLRGEYRFKQQREISVQSLQSPLDKSDCNGICDIRFRSKTKGWRKYYMEIEWLTRDCL